MFLGIGCAVIGSFQGTTAMPYLRTTQVNGRAVSALYDEFFQDRLLRREKRNLCPRDVVVSFPMRLLYRGHVFFSCFEFWETICEFTE